MLVVSAAASDVFVCVGVCGWVFVCVCVCVCVYAKVQQKTSDTDCA